MTTDTDLDGGAVRGWDRASGRVAALAAFAGFVIQLVASTAHPGTIDPNNGPGVFREYAVSETWVLVHLGQFAGAFLVALSLVLIARALRGGGLSGALATVGGAAAVVWASVFAVQMAVDGVALKAVVDSWVAAAPADRAAAFLVADAVRAVEKGLSSLFHLTNGTALLALGLSVSTSRHFPVWIGWFGVPAGIGYILGGVATAQSGFSSEADAILGAALLPGLVFLAGMALAVWRGPVVPASALRPASVSAVQA
jgi:hypothetical protein